MERISHSSKNTVMSFRFMRVFVFFDLPVLTAKERRAYRKFRKYLICSGFIMQQKSVYTKLVANGMQAKTVTDNVRKNAPSSGLIEFLIVTENQYTNIEYVNGQENSEYVSSTEKLLIL